MPKMHLRPSEEFTVTSLAWERENELIHQRAGFKPIPDEVTVRRFWQFLRFLQEVGLTSRIVVRNAAEISSDTTLRNSDLTDEGFYFIQRFRGRWVNRSYKDRGETKEDILLKKWYHQFLIEGGAP